MSIRPAPPRLGSDAPALLAALASADSDWWRRYRDDVERSLRQPFAAVLVATSAQTTTGPWPVVGSAASMTHPTRRPRFDGDTTIRSSIVGLLSSTGGRRAAEGCVHVELDRDGGFVAAGFHRPPTAVLGSVRRAILDDPAAWTGITDGLTAAGRHLDAGSLRSMPRGFSAERDHPLAADLRRTTLTITESLDLECWLDGTVVDRLVRLAHDAMPLLRFGNDADGVTHGGA